MMKKNKAGLIMTEDLLAIGLLAVATVVLGDMIRSSILTTALSKNYLIGFNLATEGVESIKSIRDTNWLKDYLHLENWLCLEWNESNECDAVQGKIESEQNYIPVNNGGTWSLVEGPMYDPDLESVDDYEDYHLKIEGVSGAFENYFIYSPEGSEHSPFYRSIYVQSVTPTQIIYDVHVQWKDGQRVRKILRTATLYNSL